MALISNDHTQEVLEALDKAIATGLESIGLAAEGFAKVNLTNSDAVDTGLLRNSITYALSGEPAAISSYHADRGGGSGSYSGSADKGKNKSVYIGTNVKYAAYVECGTGRQSTVGGNPNFNGMRARPYLKPAGTEHKKEYKEIMENALKNA